MKTAKRFKNGNSQAVRLPEAFRMASFLLPKEKSWDPLMEGLDLFEKDFNMERNQPTEDQKRDSTFS